MSVINHALGPRSTPESTFHLTATGSVGIGATQWTFRCITAACRPSKRRRARLSSRRQSRTRRFISPWTMTHVPARTETSTMSPCRQLCGCRGFVACDSLAQAQARLSCTEERVARDIDKHAVASAVRGPGAHLRCGYRRAVIRCHPVRIGHPRVRPLVQLPCLQSTCQ